MEKAELTVSICHIARFLKSGILLYNPKSQMWLAEKHRQSPMVYALRKRNKLLSKSFLRE